MDKYWLFDRTGAKITALGEAEEMIVKGQHAEASSVVPNGWCVVKGNNGRGIQISDMNVVPLARRIAMYVSSIFDLNASSIQDGDPIPTNFDCDVCLTSMIDEDTKPLASALHGILSDHGGTTYHFNDTPNVINIDGIDLSHAPSEFDMFEGITYIKGHMNDSEVKDLKLAAIRALNELRDVCYSGERIVYETPEDIYTKDSVAQLVRDVIRKKVTPLPMFDGGYLQMKSRAIFAANLVTRSLGVVCKAFVDCNYNLEAVDDFWRARMNLHGIEKKTLVDGAAGLVAVGLFTNDDYRNTSLAIIMQRYVLLLIGSVSPLFRMVPMVNTTSILDVVDAITAAQANDNLNVATQRYLQNVIEQTPVLSAQIDAFVRGYNFQASQLIGIEDYDEDNEEYNQDGDDQSSKVWALNILNAVSPAVRSSGIMFSDLVMHGDSSNGYNMLEGFLKMSHGGVSSAIPPQALLLLLDSEELAIQYYNLTKPSYMNLNLLAPPSVWEGEDGMARFMEMF